MDDYLRNSTHIQQGYGAMKTNSIQHKVQNESLLGTVY